MSTCFPRETRPPPFRSTRYGSRTGVSEKRRASMNLLRIIRAWQFRNPHLRLAYTRNTVKQQDAHFSNRPEAYSLILIHQLPARSTHPHLSYNERTSATAQLAHHIYSPPQPTASNAHIIGNHPFTPANLSILLNILKSSP